MHWISLLGLAAILGLAWSMSYHRSQVRWRPIVWGLSLQFLFAVIILRKDEWSFIGMALLGALIVLYALRATEGAAPSLQRWGAKLLVVAGVAAALTFTLRQQLGWILLGLVALVFLNAWRRLRPAAQPYLAALLVATGGAALIANGINGEQIFQQLSTKVAGFLSLSDYGAEFLFGNLARAEHYFVADGGAWPGFGFQFAFKVLPTIIFFGGFMSVLYHLGIMQKVIETLSRFMRWTIGTSGAETLSCTANIFVGQTEAPLLIKPFLPGMTRSELLTVMVGGFATIAGGVMAGYLAMGVPAAHLIAASVMGAPAALVMGKLVFPETEHAETAGDVGLPEIDSGSNVIEAAANGISDGFKLALNVGAMLIGFISLIAVVDLLLGWLDGLVDNLLLHGAYVEYAAKGLSPISGEYVGVFPGSLQTLFGTILRPLAFLIGVPWEDAAKVGNLLGVKLSLNEFVGYGALTDYIRQGALSERAAVISTYALCGFANFSSIGIQIGGISAIAPDRKSDLAKIGLRAMLAGALASLSTATIAGILLE